MSTTTAPTPPAAEREFDGRELLRQIGTMNLMGISGLRADLYDGKVILPVGHGYSVEVILAWNDSYTVTRVFTRAGVKTAKGSRSGVYFDQVGDAAYYASCFQSYDAIEWVTK
jgi:hypothetical protein